jgi:hypothetical protein
MLGSLCASPRLRGARNIRRKNTKKVLPPLPPKTPESRRKEKKKETSMYTFWMDVAVLPSSFQCTMHFGSGRRRLESLLNIERRVLTATPLSNSAAVFLARKRVPKSCQDCTIALPVHIGHGIRSMCKRFEEERSKRKRGFKTPVCSHVQEKVIRC